MAKNKFFVKFLVVLSLAVVILTACGAPKVEVAELVPGNPQYEEIKKQVLLGLVPGNPDYDLLKQQILAGNPAPTCLVVDQASCQPIVDANPPMCSAQIATAQTAWVPDGAACRQAGYGYPAMTIDSALAAVEAEEYYCYIPVVLAAPATPKPKIKREEPPPAPPVEPPPCPNCPVPPVEEPPCATCPIPPGD